MTMNEITKRIPGFIKRDFLRKAIAILFAIFVFVKVNDQIGIEDTVENVKLNLIPPQNMAILGDENINLRLTVKAPDQKTLISLSSSDFKISLTIPESKDGEMKKEMSLDNISKMAKIIKPRNVEIISIRPESIKIQLDMKTSKEIPVRVRFSGATPEEYTCGDIEVAPKKVVISGASSILEKINEVFTEPILLDSKTVESFECDSKIVLPPKVESGAEKVRVQVEVYRKIETRKFFALPIEVLSPSGTSLKILKITPTNVDVTVQGLKSAIERLSDKDLKPFIDLSKVSSAGSFEMLPMCFLSAQGVKPVEFYPEKIFVELGN